MQREEVRKQRKRRARIKFYQSADIGKSIAENKELWVDNRTGERERDRERERERERPVYPHLTMSDRVLLRSLPCTVLMYTGPVAVREAMDAAPNTFFWPEISIEPESDRTASEVEGISSDNGRERKSLLFLNRHAMIGYDMRSH